VVDPTGLGLAPVQARQSPVLITDSGPAPSRAAQPLSISHGTAAMGCGSARL